MKILTKLAFLLVFAVISASCGDKKSIYDQYGTDDNTQNGNTENDEKNDSKPENQVSDTDAGITSDEEIHDSDSEEVSTDEDKPENGDQDTAEENDSDSEPAETTDGDTEEPMNCTGFSLDPESKLLGRIPSTTYTTKVESGILGDPYIEDTFELRLDHHRFDDDPYIVAGTYDLADGDSWHNTSYWTCWECVSVRQDLKDEDEKFFFQKSGTLVIESVDSKYNFTGTLSAVLVESKNNSSSWTTTPVPNGECIEIETSFEAVTVCTPDCSGKQNGESDGCGGTCIICEETAECRSNGDCDPGHYCGNDCHCYIENPED